MAMPIQRPNSFHLMLSDDELALLRLLAERDGLTASDYLRSMMRREAAGPTPSRLSHTRQIAQLLGIDDVDHAWAAHKELTKEIAKRKPKVAKGRRSKAR